MLVLRLSAPEIPETIQLASFQNQAQATWQTVTWAEAQTALRKQSPIVVLIPSSEVQLTSSNLKAKSQRQMAQALPFALEEQIIGEPEEQHYVWTNTDKGDEFPVAIIERQRLQQWLDFLRKNNIPTRHLLPDVFCLPSQENSLSIWQQEQQLWVRETTFQGWQAPASTLPLYLEQLAADYANAEEKPQLYFYSDQAQVPTLDWDIIESDPQQLQRTDIESALGLSLSHLFVSDESSQLAQLWKPWRSTMIIALLTALIFAATQVIEIQRLSKQQQQLVKTNLQQFNTLFPNLEERDPYLLRSVAESELAARTNSTQDKKQTTRSVLPSLSTLAKALATQNKVDIKAIAWGNNRLTARLETPNTQEIERLEQKLSQLLSREINIEYRRNAGRIQANLVLEANAQ